jgi:hypothetical protein
MHETVLVKSKMQWRQEVKDAGNVEHLLKPQATVEPAQERSHMCYI